MVPDQVTRTRGRSSYFAGSRLAAVRADAVGGDAGQGSATVPAYSRAPGRCRRRRGGLPSRRRAARRGRRLPLPGAATASATSRPRGHRGRRGGRRGRVHRAPWLAERHSSALLMTVADDAAGADPAPPLGRADGAARAGATGLRAAGRPRAAGRGVVDAAADPGRPPTPRGGNARRRARPRARMARQRLAARHCPPARRASLELDPRRAGPDRIAARRGAARATRRRARRAAGTAARGASARSCAQEFARVRGRRAEAARGCSRRPRWRGPGDAAVGHRPRRRAGRPPERSPGPPPPPRLTTPDSAHGRTERITRWGTLPRGRTASRGREASSRGTPSGRAAGAGNR